MVLTITQSPDRTSEWQWSERMALRLVNFNSNAMAAKDIIQVFFISV
jgi:hypothetical protein